jgi:hypothetical protein
VATKGEKNLENHRCIRYCPWSNPFHTMLTGSDLLSKVKELGDVSKSDLVRSCGYVSTKKMVASASTSPPSMKPCWKPKA